MPHLMCLPGERVITLPWIPSAFTTATPLSSSGQSPRCATSSVVFAGPAAARGDRTTSGFPPESPRGNHQRLKGRQDLVGAAYASFLAAKPAPVIATGSSACRRDKESAGRAGVKGSATAKKFGRAAGTVLGSGGACAEDGWGFSVRGAGRGC